ncbi:hypothetical protein [Bifidobacterium sp. ESL0745]|uniref:hypothetical protein n=1 Tax=Bifidobacterium sp. ESL0745 TaxID=2983226 RepID=UPI0023F9E390|nr:hypothetical protein [Bifidobacterium sp. ESL0745]MDF7664541.1 hypothetical protein [Bifidobacterium sp. ESL0745]
MATRIAKPVEASRFSADFRVFAPLHSLSISSVTLSWRGNVIVFLLLSVQPLLHFFGVSWRAKSFDFARLLTNSSFFEVLGAPRTPFYEEYGGKVAILGCLVRQEPLNMANIDVGRNRILE